MIDPEHPLWAEQQAGWPRHDERQAWREAVDLARTMRARSADHPAFAEGAITNTLATRPDDEAEAVQHKMALDRH